MKFELEGSVRKMGFQDVQMENGKVFSGEKIGELVEVIIDKFSEEKLSCAEGKVILKKTADVLGEYSLVQKVN